MPGISKVSQAGDYNREALGECVLAMQFKQCQIAPKLLSTETEKH